MADGQDWTPTLNFRFRKRPKSESYVVQHTKVVVNKVLEQMFQSLDRKHVEWREVPTVESDAPLDKR